MDRNFKNMEFQKNQDGFEETIVQVSRVSKKTKGGNKIGFSVLMVVGDKNWAVLSKIGNGKVLPGS
jgi:small subunit ribosomal protein S5